MTEKMKKALHAAVVAAINEIGLDRFKTTSLFMSNNRKDD